MTRTFGIGMARLGVCLLTAWALHGGAYALPFRDAGWGLAGAALCKKGKGSCVGTD
jgi:hypothetical protein